MALTSCHLLICTPAERREQKTKRKKRVTSLKVESSRQTRKEKGNIIERRERKTKRNKRDTTNKKSKFAN